MIEWKNVSMTLAGRQVLSGISLKTAPGEIVFVLGKSGAGKSVLLKAAVGFLPVSGGDILLDGRSVLSFSDEDWVVARRQVALLFQFPTLLDALTVEENVALGADWHLKLSPETRGEVAEKLAWVGFPNQLKDSYPHQLSFGMQKRASLARVLMLNPQVILFDEPTTALDPIATGEINELTVRLAKELGLACVVVSHDLHCAFQIADRVMMIDEGERIFEGTPQELRGSSRPLVKAFVKEAEARLI